MADDKMRKNIRIPLFVILRTPGVWRGARWRGPAERRCGGRAGQGSTRVRHLQGQGEAPAGGPQHEPGPRPAPAARDVMS